MRYQIELGPRIPSTSTSTGSSRSAAAGYRCAPRIERGHRLVLGLGAGDLDQRHGRLSPAGTACASLRRLLGRTQFLGPIQQRVQAAWRVVDAFPRIADFGVARRHCRHRERLGPAVGHLCPVKWRRHPRVGPRTDRVGRRDGAVLGVLVEVDEDAFAAFLLPPLARRQVRCAAVRPPGRWSRRPAAPACTASADECGHRCGSRCEPDVFGQAVSP